MSLQVLRWQDTLYKQESVFLASACGRDPPGLLPKSPQRGQLHYSQPLVSPLLLLSPEGAFMVVLCFILYFPIL